MEFSLSIAVRSDGLTKEFISGESSIFALKEVSIEVMRGEFVAIMGPSGSGKSTLMQCLAGLDQPTSGRSWIGDVEITGLSDGELTKLRREQVGFIFQDFNLFPTMTAKQNILLPLKLSKRSVDQGYFDFLVNTLGIAERISHHPAELSGGQQQRVAVARALLSKPTVIFADEPTGSLDQTSSRDLIQVLLDGVTRDGQTVVMVTHDPMVAAQATRVIEIEDGRVLHRGGLSDPAVSHHRKG